MSTSRSRPQVRVLLVDSTGGLPFLARALFESGALIPSSTGCTFSVLLEVLHTDRPDVVVMDVGGGNNEALEMIQAVMAERPTPILVLHSVGLWKNDAFRALKMGALDVMERPDTPDEAYWRELERRLVLLAKVRVVQHVQGKLHRRRPEDEPLPFPAVAIGASLGGPRALSQLLRALPKAFPAPILICQHIGDGFTAGLAKWLSSECSLRVLEGAHGDSLQKGTAYIAPSGAHMMVGARGTIELNTGPPLAGFKPSCDALLRSVAASFGQRAVGVILTGMGKDGARGLKEIRLQGGRTIAQDAASCVVFGMPREAIALGAAQEVLPLDHIAPTLVRWMAER